MATFSVPTTRTAEGGAHKFTLINHSKAQLTYDFREFTKDQNPVYGSVEPGQTFVTPEMQLGIMEVGNISSIIAISGAPNPSFRFWSGGPSFGERSKDQYINLLEGNGYGVTTDTSEMSEITGNGFRITVDGGGVEDPTTGDIHIQVYNT
jgi:hypothetical protein